MVDTAQVVAAAPELSFVQVILTEAVKGVLAVVGVALTAALAAAFNYLREKKKIEIRKDVEQRILGWIPIGIARAEEVALKKIRDPDSSEVLTGEMKQAVAMKTITSIVPEFDKLPVDTQAALIDAKLNQLRRAPSILPPPGLSPSILAGTPGSIPRAAPVPAMEGKGA